MANAQMLHANRDWHTIWSNLSVLKREPPVHDLMYQMIHGIYPTKALLALYRIQEDALSRLCRMDDTLEHQLKSTGGLDLAMILIYSSSRY